MLAYVLDAWAGSGTEHAVAAPIVVYSPATASLLEAGLPGDPTFALQADPRGTADAVRAGLVALPDGVTEVLVLSGDVPLVIGPQLRAVLEQRRMDDAAIALASVFAASPGALGRVVRSEFGTVERIAEAKDGSPDELDSNEVNAGCYAFDAAWLRRRIESVEPSATTGELYLTELIRLAREDGRIVSAVGFDDDGTFDGINDRAQLAQAEWALRVRCNEAHMAAGVTMRDPSTAYLDWDVELLRQDLLMHYLLSVPCFEEDGKRPPVMADAQDEGIVAGRAAFHAKFKSLGDFAPQLLSLVMLNVLDEKWKDHLYDLDQLRNAIHYRSWGQKDPLLEYKSEAYTMFVDLMNDVHHTFAERFLRVQVVFEGGDGGGAPGRGAGPSRAPARRFNALGVAEETETSGDGAVLDVGPGEPGERAAAVRPERPAYRKLLWRGDRLTGAIIIGQAGDVWTTNDVGMLKGLVQTGVRLGAWKEHLRRNPFDVKPAFIASRTTARLLPETTLGRPSRAPELPTTVTR